MSNICKRPAVQKGQRLNKKPNRPDAGDLERWTKIRALGCILRFFGFTGCAGGNTLHHIKTGAGGRKNHKRVVPLCWTHHLSPEGIDGKRYSKRGWQERYVTEDEMEYKTKVLLGEI